VGELSGLDDTGIEGLSRFAIELTMALEKVASRFRERDEGSSFPIAAIQRYHRANQPCGAQTIQIAMPQIGWTLPFVTQVVQRHDAKGPDSRQGPDLGSSKIVIVLVNMNALAVESTGKV
jgi:hypothetical protein